MDKKSDDLSLQALLLVDHIYRDRGSGKFILAGVFQRVFAPEFPTNFGRTVGIYLSILGLDGQAEIEIRFIDPEDGKVWMRRQGIPISSQTPGLPVELAVEVPHMPLPHAGTFLFQVWSGEMKLGEIPLIVEKVETQNESALVELDRNE